MSQQEQKHPVVFGMRPLWPGQLARVEMHQTRTGGDLSHINPERTHLNQFLIGNENWREYVTEGLRRVSELNFRHTYHARRWRRKRKKEALELKRIGPQDPWKSDRSEGPMREGVLTANAKFFEGDVPGFSCPAKIAAFRVCAKKFLVNNYGTACVAAWEDQDEEAFHIHFVVVPLVETESKNSGKQRMLVPSAIPIIKSYEHGHDVAAECFKDIGLVRGEERAKRRRAALEAEQECELPAQNIPCHIWRADEAVRLDEKREKAKEAEAVAEEKRREEEAARVAARKERERLSRDMIVAEKRRKLAERERILRLREAEEKATERRAREDNIRADRIAEEERQREEKAADIKAREDAVADREEEISRKAKLLGRAVGKFYTIFEKVKSFARKLGIKDDVLDQSELDAVKRIKDQVGGLGGVQRQRAK
ncbi:plasmid recombination protein [Sulfitobacter sp.]|uniref:plasmid recombination protein n=1 Tax=Sulfitobacter sp. TaxID=1903071 RepID=UPI00272AA61C|nr:hypothetical protein [Sulfitobacter sp.]